MFVRFAVGTNMLANKQMNEHLHMLVMTKKLSKHKPDQHVGLICWSKCWPTCCPVCARLYIMQNIKIFVAKCSALRDI